MARITGTMTVDELFVELARLGVHSVAVVRSSLPSPRYTVHLGHMAGQGFAAGTRGSASEAFAVAQSCVEDDIAADVASGEVVP